MAGIIKDEQYHKPERGFAAGYELETLPDALQNFALRQAGGWKRICARH
jgi:hypothetical protein